MASSRWDSQRAPGYDEKWQRMAARGENPHGEADFVQRFAPATVLDAGCGTGRVAIELAARGIDVVGTDIDQAMLDVAAEKAPATEWVCVDLASLSLDRTFDVVVMAGNVVLFVAPGTEQAVVAGAARHVAEGGALIAGFGLAHGVGVADWELWVSAAGLTPTERWSTWAGDEFDESSHYVVSVAKR